MKGKNLFITGGTGGIGREFIRIFLDETEDQLFLLVRSKSSDSHEGRIEKLLLQMGINGKSKSRIRVFAGDVTQSKLGLSSHDWDFVVRETDEFYHIAALTTLGAEWEESKKINLDGTRYALELAGEAADRGRCKRFFYFSTAYVAGSLTPTHALEDELPSNPSFANTYEETKFLAEKEVRQKAGRGLATTIFRPSIVVGDSKGGAISEFNVVYPFWRLFAHGLLKKVPSRLENSINIVPIDFVVQAAFAIASQEGSMGKTFHLVTETPPTLEMLLQVKGEYGQFPPLEIVSPEEFSIEDLDQHERAIFPTLLPYLGYLGSSLTFDTRNTRQALRNSPISFPKTDTAFLRKIIDYAIEKGYFLSPS